MSEFIEFKAPEIGLNHAKKIKPTNKVMRRVWSLQLAQAKAATEEDPTDFESLENSVKSGLSLLDATEDFLTTTLSLSKKQQDALEDLTQDELGELAGRLQVLIIKADRDIPDTDAEDEPDPKSDSDAE